MAVARRILDDRTSLTVRGVSWRTDLLTCELSAWLVVGAFVDGWAHNTKAGLWEVSDFQLRAGVASFILASVFLFGPLLLPLRSWPLPAGAVVVVIGVQSSWCRR